MARIAVIPGDGIGVEVIPAAVKVLRAAAARSELELEVDHWNLGADRYLETGVTITDDEMRQLAGYDAVLLGAFGDPRVPDNAHARDILLGMRFRLDLYINLRPIRLLDPRLTPLRDVAAIDMVIFRENTEGVYVGVGGSFKKDTPDEIAIEEDLNTRRGVERIIRAAFEYALEHGRGRVSMADKANAMRHVGGLWRRVFADVAAEYDEIQAEALYIDMLALDVVRRPSRYEVIVTSNLFGDILSDLAAALVGGLGLAPSGNIHPGRIGVFEPVHGSAPDLVGSDRANPMAAILTVGMMLDFLGRADAGAAVERAVRLALAREQTTPDLGGRLSTGAVGDFVAEAVAATAAEPLA
ncbi:MAG: isocitrate/isopropylmalate dehydrogenase family protein [Longimicrobiales bacterium]